MIKSLKIHGFKCFKDIQIPLGKLSLFAGMNAAGKSSAIQSLLLLRQAFERSRSFSANQAYYDLPLELHLNGDMVSLGTSRDVTNKDSENDIVIFTIYESNDSDNGSWDCMNPYDFAFGESESNAYYDERHLNYVGGTGTYNNVDLFKANRFTYLKAERLGPRPRYDLSEKPEETMDVGCMGEYAAHCLAEFRDSKPKNTLLKHPDHNKKQTSTQYQVQQWMGDFFPGITINAELNRAAEAAIVLYGFEGSGHKDKPLNTGFGISYTLPIIVAAMISSVGDIMIVENPEAHLHPAGQSMMGRFLARVAASGVQVIVETHSDHILNGVRLAVKNNFIEPADVKINFFIKHLKKGHYIETPEINEKGRLKSWPKGFFDQAESDFEELM